MEAVRTTWFGRLLTESRTLCVLVASYLAAVAVVYSRLWQPFAALYNDHPAGFTALTIGPVAFIFCFATLPPAVRAWWKRRRAAIALQAGSVGSSYRLYFRLSPYVSETPDDFHRDDGAHQHLLSWIRQNRRPVLFLSGSSGAGKTSVLDGFVLPKLRADGWSVVEIRGLDNPLIDLERAVSAPRAPNKNLLVVFDQFEEFVILEGRSGTSQRQKFVERVRIMRGEQRPNIFLLFSYRADYQSQILSLELEDLRSDSTWIEIANFDRSAARRFLAGAPQRPSRGLIGRMLDGADELDGTPGIYRPVILNMLGLMLQRSDQIFTDSPHRMVQSFLELAMAERPIRDIAPRVIQRLITSAATKQSKTLEELAKETALVASDVLACLIRLEARGLVRRIGDRAQIWELSHDFVAQQFAILLGRIPWHLWPRFAAVATPVFFAAILAAVVAFVPSYLEYHAEHGVRVLGGSLSVDHDSVVARFPAISAGDLQAAAPYLREADVKVLNVKQDSKLATLPVMRHFPPLTEVDLDDTNVTDLTPLNELTKLITLSLRETSAHDLEPLRSLTNLQIIDLYKVGEVDLEPLRALPHLKTLDLGWVYLAEAHQLDRLSTLESLKLTGTNVQGRSGWVKLNEVSSLSRLTSLKLLDLSWTDVSDLSPLSNLMELRTLGLNGTRASLEPLKGLYGLQALHLDETNTDLNVLRNLVALQELTVRQTWTSNLEPIAGLKTLRLLDLAATDITNLEPLSGLSGLEKLDVSYIRRPGPLDLTPLSSLSALTNISIVGTRVQDLGPLEDLPKLKQVTCSTELLTQAQIARFQRNRLSKGLNAVSVCPGSH